MLRIATVGASLFLVLVVLYLVRKRSLREDQAIGWLVGGVVLVVLAAIPQILEFFAETLGVEVPTNLLYAVAVYVLTLLTLGQQVQISRIRDRERRLAQELAILGVGDLNDPD